MHFSIPFLLITAAVNGVLGVFVLSRSKQSAMGRSFAGITFSVFVWCIGMIGFYSFRSKDFLQLSVQTYYVAALLMNASLLIFTAEFLGIKNKLIRYTPLFIWAAVSLSVLLIPDSLFVIDSLQTHGADISMNPIGYGIYTFFVIGFYLTTLGLFMSRVHVKDSRERSQARTILTGLFVTGILASYFNVFLPWIGNYSHVWSGPLFTAVFVSLIFYSIVKHGLFDIKSVFTRALVYILSIASVVGMYLLAIFILSGTGIFGEDLTVLQRAVFLTVAIISSLITPIFKRFFDRITNKIFFRDSYEPQELIDQLNNALVATSDIETLLSRTTQIIKSEIKVESVIFYIRETSYFPSRFLGDVTHSKLNQEDVEYLLAIAPKTRSKVHSTFLDPTNEVEQQMNKVLKKNDVEIVGRLVSTLEFQVKGIGMFFLGAKSSGSSYSKQDLKVLEIIANELVIAIENVLRYEEIEQFNVTLQKKIDAATKELQESNDKLRALDEAKDEFVSMASHQLRTPLTSIKGYLSMVLEGDAGKITDTQKEMLGQAFFSSQRMVYLISDLLNVSRLKTGKFIIERSPVNLAKLVEEEVSQLQEGAKAKGITLSFKAPKSVPDLMLDDMKTRQVVMNFTDNAIYYTPEGGKIKLEIHNREKVVEFTVSDNGIGVPKDQQHKLFGKFFRADNARKARPDGTGLGLFMAKKVIISQGGSIIFKSKEGKGSTFGFTFPKEDLLPEKLAAVEESES